MAYYSGDKSLIPLGSPDRPFNGHIDGYNGTVKNIHIDGSGCSDIGIFGYVGEDATISNIYFDSATIDCKGATAGTPGATEHVAHNTHVYSGYLAGHVYEPSSFSNVYLNNCKILNSVANNYETINKHGYFGHSDRDLSSTSNSNSYMTQLNAATAYEAIDFTYTNGSGDSLALRNTQVLASGHLDGAITQGSSKYTIKEKTGTSGGPYSLSSVGYASGNNGVDAYVRYITTEGGLQHLNKIENVVSENILDDKPANNFYGYNDGDYIYYDTLNGIWKYAQVVGDTAHPAQGTIELNCFTISYKRNSNTYYLKYQSGTPYGKLVAEQKSSVPTGLEYYFCFRSSFGHPGVTRLTYCTEDTEYYIYSPSCQKYVCTYAPQDVSGNSCASTSLVHTPVFVDQAGTNGHLPTKFNVSGPFTQLTYKAVNNNINSGNVNNDFDNNTSTTITVGALQGSNLSYSGSTVIFGGHQQSYYCYGGEFYIGQDVSSQTTTLNNAVDYIMTNDFYSNVTEGSTVLLAGYDGEQNSSASTDYGLSTQASDYRVVKKVTEVREGSNYVIQTTTGISGLTVHYTGGTYTQRYLDDWDRERTRNQRVFTLYSNGYLYCEGDNSDKVLTKDPSFDLANDTDNSCKWVAYPIENGSFTRYRFQNVGHPTRFLCYDSQSTTNRVFRCQINGQTQYQNYTPGSQNYNTYYNRAINGGYFSNTSSGTQSSTKWFYAYKQRTGQTLSNIKYVIATPKTITTTIYPTKTVTEYDLKYAPVRDTTNPNDPAAYSTFEVEPSNSLSFDTEQSQVHYDDFSIETWKRVSIVSELKNGDSVIIVSNTNNYIMSTTQNDNSRGRIGATINPPYFKNESLPSTAQVFTLVKNGSTWRFDTGSGFLYAASSSTNSLKTEAAADSNGNADFSISISMTTGDATIVATGNNTRNRMRYTTNNNQNRYFTCSNTDIGNAVQIYKLIRSGLNEAVYVGDLMNNFEPDRMDAVGPNIDYYPTYMQMTGTPSIIKSPTNTSAFYSTSFVKNAFTLLIDYTGSRDLGTLVYDTTSASSSQPYFMKSSGNVSLGTAGAVDVGENSAHSYLLNINESNIDNVAFCCLKGDGTEYSPYEICSSDDSNLTKYVIVLGCDTTVQTTNISFTFNNDNGNVGFSGAVDFRTATYDENGVFTGSPAGGQMVAESNLSIFYDVTNTGQKVSLTVNYEFDANEGENGEYVYTVTIDSTETVLTKDLVINIYKYDNNASILKVVVNGQSTTYYGGTTSIVLTGSSS